MHTVLYHVNTPHHTTLSSYIISLAQVLAELDISLKKLRLH